MRRIHYFVAASLDAFIARRDGGVEWLFTDQDYGMSEFFASVDTCVMGRKSYDRMRELTPGQNAWPGMRNYVFTRTLPAGTRDEVEFVSGDVADWARTARTAPGKDIWLLGGGELASQFLGAGCIDEIAIAIHPRLLSDGLPLFPQPYPETTLELIRCKPYSTGLVHLFYRVKH